MNDRPIPETIPPTVDLRARLRENLREGRLLRRLLTVAQERDRLATRAKPKRQVPPIVGSRPESDSEYRNS